MMSPSDRSPRRDLTVAGGNSERSWLVSRATIRSPASSATRLARTTAAARTHSERGRQPPSRMRRASVGLVWSPVDVVGSQRAEECVLVAPGHDVDALPAAHLLAQLAPDAGLLVHLDAAQVGGHVVGRRRDAVERADVDADAAPVAVVGVHDRDRPFLALEHLRDVAVGVEDGLVGADHAAGTAVDAERGLDVVGLLRVPADRLRRAALLAGSTARTVLGDDREGHGGGPYQRGAPTATVSAASP